MKRLIVFFSLLYVMINVSSINYVVNGLIYSKINETYKWVQVGWEGGYYNAVVDSRVTTYTVPSTIQLDGVTYKVVKIGDYAFENCRLTTNINIPSTVTVIGKYAFSGSGITSIEIPNSVVRIEEKAFSYCNALTSITLPNQLVAIKPGIVTGCANIHSVSVPNSVSIIEGNGFSNSNDLYEIFIPPSVFKIDSYAINSCWYLGKIYLRNSDPYSITIGNNIVNDCDPITTFCVPPGTKVSYQGAPQWSGYNFLEEESNALHFDGIDDYVSLPMELPMLKQSYFTIEMWIKPDEIPATGFIALLNDDSWNTDTNGSSVHFQLSDSKLSLAVHGLTNHPTSTYTPVANVWQHIAVTYNAYSDTVKFYANGNLVSKIKAPLNSFAKIEASCLGSWLGTQRFFHGAIDEVRVWRSERTEQQIKDNMNVTAESIQERFFLQYSYNFNQGFAFELGTYAPRSNEYQTYLTDYKSACDGILRNFALEYNTVTSTFVQGVNFPYLYLSSKIDTIDSANNSTDTIKVSSNVKWHVQSDQSWLTANLDSLAGNGQFILTATANPANETRTATVTVSATGVLDKTITITQSAYVNTGIESPSKETLTFLPNPASDDFTINVGEQKSTLSIYDNNGRLVLSKQIEGKSYVDISSLSSGIYMVKANGLVGKLIKK